MAVREHGTKRAKSDSPVYEPRFLPPQFKQHLLNGFLQPLLQLVQRDRDLIAEIRANALDIYCKGQRLIRVEASGDTAYKFTSDKKFWPDGIGVFTEREPARLKRFCSNQVPHIKQKIAKNSKGREIEFEQMLIRSNTREVLNTDYITVDRQGMVAENRGRTDVIGVYWPDHKLDRADVALIEVKYRLGGGIEGLASQVEKYFNHISSNLESFVDGLQVQFRQKAELGLLSGLNTEAQKKIQRVKILKQKERIKVVIALVDYNPRSTILSKAQREVAKLPFADQVRLFHLGFGMWEAYAEPAWTAV